MNEILEALKNTALKRMDQWQTFYVQKFPDEKYFNELVILGTFSYSLPSTRRRIVAERIKLDEEIYETPSAIARDYLRHVYKCGPKATRRQLENVRGIPPVPSYAAPRSFADGRYIDIQSAYWSLMKIIGWNVDYNPGLWLSPGRPPSDFPFPDHKVARNCLVSAGRMGGVDPETKEPIGIPIYDPHKLPGNPYTTLIRGSELKNNQLVRLIHDVLNAIADQAIKEGAIYANNDGYIVPDEASANRVIGVVMDWGLMPRIKARGGGRVKASGTYEVGKIKTLNYEAMGGVLPIRNVYSPDYAKWLQKEFSFFVAKGNQI